MTFDPTKPVQTRGGQPARVICTDLKALCSMVVAVTMREGIDAGQEVIHTYLPTGEWAKQEPPHDLDLVNIPQRHKHADLIIAWANGAKIQVFCPIIEGYKNSIRNKWVDKTGAILWCEEYQYRVKPE